MSVLRTKFRRDLRRGPAQLVSVAVLVMIGIALYGASYDAYRNLDASYASIFDDYSFADLTVSGGDVQAVARQAEAVEGVSKVAVRTVADVPLRMPGGQTMVGRVVGLPPDHQPSVNQVTVGEGAYLSPSVPDGVLAEQHIADHAGLRPGSAVGVHWGGAWHTVDVRGTATSAEYLWPAASRQNALPAPGSFGVLFVPEPLARTIAGTQAPNQTAIYYNDQGRADAPRLDARLAAMARQHGATGTFTREEQPSNAILAEDIKGFSELSYMFPMLFLTAAGVAIYVVLTRRVARDRSLIGMLRASGFRRRTILGHYLATGLFAGLAGAVPGVLAGLALAGTVTRLYTDAIGIPETLISVRATTVAGGLAFGLVAGGLAALAPAVAAARVPPAQAMRGAVPSQHGGRGPLARLEGVLPVLRRLPAGAWLVLRGPTRQLRRTLYTELGVVLALVLILVSWGMLDTVRATVERQFDRVQTHDAELRLDRPADPALLAGLEGAPGVAAAEPSVQVPASIVADGGAYGTSVIGLRQGTAMHGFLTPDGGRRALPGDGLLLGVALRDQLGLRTGDTVTLRLAGGGTATTKVAGFVDEPLGTYAYASIKQMAAIAPQARPQTAFLKLEPGADRAAVERAVTARPGVVAYTDTRALKSTVEDFMGLFYAFVGIMLVFGAVLAFTVLYATMSVNLSERSVEIATLRASGVGRARLARLITWENLLLVVLGVVPGLVLGRLAVGGFLGTFDNDLMRFGAEVAPATYAWSAAAVTAVALLAQWPGLRALGRIDLAAVVRERAS